MVDNRYATALVIAAVLSVLASVYLSVSVGSPHWYRYTSPPVHAEHNATELRALQEEFLDGEFDEKTASDALFRMNGTLGLWWRCVQTHLDAHWYKEHGTHSIITIIKMIVTHTQCVFMFTQLCLLCSDPQMVLECVSFTPSQQFTPKYKEPGNHNSGEDMIRTYLWRCQFLLPLVSLGLVVLGGLIGFCACVCSSLAPALFIGLLQLLAGLCSLATVCCFLAGMDLLHRVSMLPDRVDASLGWSLYLALIASPLYMMSAALLVWAARSHSQTYDRMAVYRVA
ncbi:claudin domain-containing protein 1a isoform X1 [Myxocyprinus asiaticus]|uniref:claudin domain-containing protein 1a isoform X1 n=1 Tax=Myxocyprinus asiaticus TaxID=70543 RepID=UPI00222153F8|nr:claudin domain-containing protein 1a isoform X1 [Myxocyprinus asiaticus]